MKQFIFILCVICTWKFQAAGQTSAMDNKVSESVTFSKKPKNPGIYGVFEGRSPCEQISRQMHGGLSADVDHLKWQLSLFRDSLTTKPTTYLLTTEMFNYKPMTGNWRITNQTKFGAKATVYILEGNKACGPLYLLKGDENVLFILDENFNFLTGDKDFSYTLSRVNKVLGAPGH